MKRHVAKSILNQWKGVSLDELNRALRSNRALNKDQAISCRTLQIAIKRYEGHQVNEVWRDDYLERLECESISEEMSNRIIVSYFMSLKGVIFKRPEFLGTSTSRWKHLKDKFVLKIILPRHQGKGVYLRKLLEEHKHAEDEILLARNSKFMVVEIDASNKTIVLKKVKRNKKAIHICMGDVMKNYATRTFPEWFPEVCPRFTNEARVIFENF
jgi:hypothetical protein